MQQLVAQSNAFVSGLSSKARIAIVAGIIVLAAAAGTLAFFLHDTGTALFARPLDAAQQTEVQERLTGWDVPYRLSADNVIVDPAHKRDVLLRLAMLGVPHQHVTTSSDVLKSVSALTPQTVLDEQVRQGLEGDLAEGLRGITGVSDARVLIAPATRGFFVDEPSHEASASVRVSLDAGTVLGPQAVAGIRSYVANAVAGLAADHVAIVDQNGVSLNVKPSGGDGSEDTALESTLQGALDRTVGAGRTIVLARLETDPTSSSVHEIKRSPVLGAALATDSVHERYHGKDKQYDKLHQTTDRGSDTVERNTRFEAGRTDRRSVAVFVDDKIASAVPQIQNVVGAAAGLVAARGDTLVVQPMAFNAVPSLPVQVARRSFETASLASSLPIVLLALAVLGAGTFLFRSVAPALRAQTETAAFVEKQIAVASYSDEPQRVHAAIAGEPVHAAAAILAALPAPTTAAVLEMYEAGERREIVRRLTHPLAPVVRDVSARVSGV